MAASTRTRVKVKVRVRAPRPTYKVVQYYGYKDDPPNWAWLGLTTAVAAGLLVALVRMV